MKRFLTARAANAARLLLLFAICNAHLAAARAQTAAPPSPSTPAPMPSLTPATIHWRKVAESSQIFSGKITRVTEEPRIEGWPMRRFTFKVTYDQTIKGARPKGAVTAGYITPPDEPGYDAFIASRSRGQNLLFWGTGFSTEPPLIADETLIEAFKAEVANQARLAANFQHSSAAVPDRLHRRVKVLIDILRTNTDRNDYILREKARAYLLRLGPAGAPSVIRQLDDRRSLPGDLIGFANEPGFWESKYYQKPEKVIDLLAPFLPMMTGQGGLDFPLYKGGTEADYQAAIAGWRVWLCYTMAAEAKAQAAKKTGIAEKPLQ